MNFLVWRRGMRSPIASLDLMDPRQSMDWKVNEQSTIAIVPLLDHERDMSLNSLIALHPCPEIAE